MHINISNRVLIAEHLNHLTFIFLPDKLTLRDDMLLLYLLGIFNTSLIIIQRAQIKYTVDY